MKSLNLYWSNGLHNEYFSVHNFHSIAVILQDMICALKNTIWGSIDKKDKISRSPSMLIMTWLDHHLMKIKAGVDKQLHTYSIESKLDRLKYWLSLYHFVEDYLEQSQCNELWEFKIQKVVKSKHAFLGYSSENLCKSTSGMSYFRYLIIFNIHATPCTLYSTSSKHFP